MTNKGSFRNIFLGDVKGSLRRDPDQHAQPTASGSSYPDTGNVDSVALPSLVISDTLLFMDARMQEESTPSSDIYSMQAAQIVPDSFMSAAGHPIARLCTRTDERLQQPPYRLMVHTEASSSHPGSSFSDLPGQSLYMLSSDSTSSPSQPHHMWGQHDQGFSVTAAAPFSHICSASFGNINNPLSGAAMGAFRTRSTSYYHMQQGYSIGADLMTQPYSQSQPWPTQQDHVSLGAQLYPPQHPLAVTSYVGASQLTASPSFMPHQVASGGLNTDIPVMAAPASAPTPVVPAAVTMMTSEGTGATRFPCNICNRTFDRLYNRATHEKTHLPMKHREYGCNSCELRFNRDSDLRRHQASVHSLDRPFICERGCDMKFAREDARDKHHNAKTHREVSLSHGPHLSRTRSACRRRPF